MTAPLQPVLSTAEVEAQLQRAGWELRDLHVNTHVGRLRVELRRHDGLLLTLDVNPLRGTLTRQRCEHVQERTGRRGDRSVISVLRLRFLGRDTFLAEHAVRKLCEYVQDNPAIGHSADFATLHGWFRATLPEKLLGRATGE